MKQLLKENIWIEGLDEIELGSSIELPLNSTPLYLGIVAEIPRQLAHEVVANKYGGYYI